MFCYCCLLEIIGARIAGFFRERRGPSSRAVDSGNLFIGVFSRFAGVFYRRDAEARRRCFFIVVYWK